MRRCRIISIAVLALIGLQESASAQPGPGPRWIGLIGCWIIAPRGSATDSERDARIVCITPAADANVATVAVVADGRIVSRLRIDAGGRPQAIDMNGCAGTQRASWSGDGRRLYLKSSTACGAPVVETTALLAVTGTGEWLDVRRISSAGRSEVRVARYRDVGVASTIPAEIASVLGDRSMSIQTGRIAAGASISSNAIIEATRVTDAEIVEAWVRESGERFALDSRALRALTDSGVPTLVTDAMIGATYSGAIDMAGSSWHSGPYGRGASDAWDPETGVRRILPAHPYYDPWGNGNWGGTQRVAFGLAPWEFGLGYADLVGYPTLFGWTRTVTGYVKPPVLVLRDKATPAGEAATPAVAPAAKAEGNGLPGDAPVSSPADKKTTTASSTPPAPVPTRAQVGSARGAGRP